MVGGAAEHLGALNFEQVHIAQKQPEVIVGDFARRFALGARGLLDFVLTGVGIVGHMANVGHVHDVLDVVTVELERALERIDEKIGAHVPQMGRQIHGRAA